MIFGHSQDSQHWHFDGNVIRFNKNRNKYLDLDGSNTSNGANIQLCECNGTDAQKWIYDAVAQTFRSWINPNKCIDVKESKFNDRTNIQLWDCNGTEAQHWIYNGVTQEIRSSINLNKCIDVDDRGTNNGTNIQLYDCNGTGAQQFVLGSVPCIDDTTPPVAIGVCSEFRVSIFYNHESSRILSH